MLVMPNTLPADISKPDLDLELLSPYDATRLLDHVSEDMFFRYAFRTMLFRAPDEASSERYRQFLSTPHGRRFVVQDIMGDTEFLQRYGAKQRRKMAIDRFICEIFQDVLARLPDDGAMATYTAMAKKSNGRARVQSAILRSSEGQRRGGGRLGRIVGLARFAASGPLLAAPLRRRILALLTARRLGRIRHSCWRDIFRKHREVRPEDANSLARPICYSVAHADWHEGITDPINPATASAQDINDWVFRRAYVDAHRQALVAEEAVV